MTVCKKKAKIHQGSVNSFTGSRFTRCVFSSRHDNSRPAATLTGPPLASPCGVWADLIARLSLLQHLRRYAA